MSIKTRKNHNTMKRISSICLLLSLFIAAQAQMQDPVKFKSELKTGSGPEAEMVFTATIDPGWHVYSTDIGDDGPTRATFHADRPFLYVISEQSSGVIFFIGQYMGD